MLEAVSSLLQQRPIDHYMAEDDSQSYLWLLVVTIGIQLGLIFSLIHLFLKIWEHTRVPDSDLDDSPFRRVGRVTLICNFAFLELAIVSRLITTCLFLFHVLGLAEGELPVTTIRLLYHCALLCVCITYTISLYQWVFFNLRVGLYGGVYSPSGFKRSFFINKYLYSASAFVVLLTSLSMGLA